MTPKLCPKCGAGMVIKTNRSTGSQFYGCSRYPACNGTATVDEQLPEAKPSANLDSYILEADRVAGRELSLVETALIVALAKTYGGTTRESVAKAFARCEIVQIEQTRARWREEKAKVRGKKPEKAKEPDFLEETGLVIPCTPDTPLPSPMTGPADAAMPEETLSKERYSRELDPVYRDYFGEWSDVQSDGFHS